MATWPKAAVLRTRASALILFTKHKCKTRRARAAASRWCRHSPRFAQLPKRGTERDQCEGPDSRAQHSPRERRVLDRVAFAHLADFQTTDAGVCGHVTNRH